MLALLALVGFTSPNHAQQRPFSVDDLFELESVGRYYGGPYAFSPDGQMLAITLNRAAKTLTNFKREYLWGNAGADIWLQRSPSLKPVNLTRGEGDGSGWWAPQWSPDGRRLAMLSTRGGSVHMWVWNRGTGEISQLSPRSVDLVDVDPPPFLWIDATHLLFPALLGGEGPRQMMVELQTPVIATREWPKAARGLEATASVVDSGAPSHLSPKSREILVQVDVETATESILVRRYTRGWQLSPRGGVVAFSQQLSSYVPREGELLPTDLSGTWGPGLVTASGTPLRIAGDASTDILPGSLRWSPTGSQLAFLGYAPTRNESPRLYIVRMLQRDVISRSLGGVDASPVEGEESQIEWASEGALVVRARTLAGNAHPARAQRRDWWLVDITDVTRAPKALTSALRVPPTQLWHQSRTEYLVGVSEGSIWRLDPAHDAIENLTERFKGTIERLLWPRREGRAEYAPAGRTYSHLVVAVSEGGADSPYRIDLESRDITLIRKPEPQGELVAYSPASESAVFYSNDRNGMRLWRSEVGKSNSVSLIRANEFLKDVAEADFLSIQYVSLKGLALRGWILLPTDYQRGKRYPLLTWVYPGANYGLRAPSSMGISSTNSLNLQVAAARGYAVLLPSMPLAPEGTKDDPLSHLTEGVLPAVDKAVELGIADPAQLFLMGHSFGGFATYGLITQTQRFKAAVALAGATNLVSLYGEFDARDRYTEGPLAYLSLQTLLESSQFRMGSAPWKDWNRYLRNSPIYYVEHVRTPLMIIQGDMDYIPLQQGEEFFTALYRQGKRAEFVRYWGEGHVLQSPANIRDMWKRIFAWFAGFGDIQRDAAGNLVFEHDQVQSRKSASVVP